MDVEGGMSKEVFSCKWEDVFEKLLDTLDKMNVKYGDIDYGPLKDYRGNLKFPDYEVFPGIFFPDQKVNFYAKKDALFSKSKILIISIYQSKNGPTLVNIDKADPSIMYGWQDTIANPGYERFEQKILTKLKYQLKK